MSDAEVVIFRPKPPTPANDDEDEGPHLSGEALCDACGHHWAAVAPVGVVHLECPNCRRMWGVLKNAVEPEESWRCNCGEHLFFITPKGCLCRRCGTIQDAYL